MKSRKEDKCALHFFQKQTGIWMPSQQPESRIISVQCRSARRLWRGNLVRRCILEDRRLSAAPVKQLSAGSSKGGTQERECGKEQLKLKWRSYLSFGLGHDECLQMKDFVRRQNIYGYSDVLTEDDWTVFLLYRRSGASFCRSHWNCAGLQEGLSSRRRNEQRPNLYACNATISFLFQRSLSCTRTFTCGHYRSWRKVSCRPLVTLASWPHSAPDRRSAQAVHFPVQIQLRHCEFNLDWVVSVN